VSGSTSIEWTETTWNPVTGCDRISPGCDHCYALTLAKRLKAMGQAKYQHDGDPRTSGPGFGVTVHPAAVNLPLRWRAGRMIFVNSMSDLFHARVPRPWVCDIFAVMAAARQHTFQVLTKRPRRARSLLSDPDFARQIRDRAIGKGLPAGEWQWPLPGVWLGTSIESDDYTWRARELRQAPASVRFLSLEPLLGPVPGLDLTGIGWVIAGGESGPGCRPLDLDWVRDVRDRCVSLRIPLFFKQVGGITPKAGGRLLDGRTWDEFPRSALVRGTETSGTGAL
jgi:protein gp37